MIRAKIGDSLIDLTTLSPQKELVEKSFDLEPRQLSFGEVRMESLLSSDKWRTRRTEGKDQTKNHRAKDAACISRQSQPEPSNQMSPTPSQLPKCSDEIQSCGADP